MLNISPHAVSLEPGAQVKRVEQRLRRWIQFLNFTIFYLGVSIYIFFTKKGCFHEKNGNDSCYGNG